MSNVSQDQCNELVERIQHLLAERDRNDSIFDSLKSKYEVFYRCPEAISFIVLEDEVNKLWKLLEPGVVKVEREIND